MRKKYEAEPEEPVEREGAMEFMFGELDDESVAELDEDWVEIWDMGRKDYYDGLDKVMKEDEMKSLKRDDYNGIDDDEIDE